jgi:Zn-finger protein
LKRLEKEEDNKFPCCFEGFLRHKCLFCWCIFSILISLAIATVISKALMAHGEIKKKKYATQYKRKVHLDC